MKHVVLPIFIVATMAITTLNHAAARSVDPAQQVEHVVAMADDPGVTGATITQAQILQVQAFEQARADADQTQIDADQAIIDSPDSTPDQVTAAQADQQTALQDQEEALALANNICVKALSGNPKDKSKVAFLYDSLVVAGSIPGA